MENYVKEQEYRLFHRNQAYNRVTPEAGMYYIPNGNAGTIFLRLFFHPELVDGLKNRLRDRFQIPVISLLPLYLPACVQIMQERQQLGVLCLREQEQFVHWLNDGENIRVFARQPGWYRVSRGSDDDGKMMLCGGLYHAVDAGKVKDAVGWF